MHLPSSRMLMNIIVAVIACEQALSCGVGGWREEERKLAGFFASFFFLSLILPLLSFFFAEYHTYLKLSLLSINLNASSDSGSSVLPMKLKHL